MLLRCTGIKLVTLALSLFHLNFCASFETSLPGNDFSFSRYHKCKQSHKLGNCRTPTSDPFKQTNLAIRLFPVQTKYSDGMCEEHFLPPDCAEEKVLRARMSRDKLPPEFAVSGDYSIELYNSGEAPSKVQRACFDLLKLNMEGMYRDNAWDWSDRVKLAELEHPLARLLVATRRQESDLGAPGRKSERLEVAAFAHYRYELEDLDPAVPESYINSSAPAELATEAVLYVYELQVGGVLVRAGSVPKFHNKVCACAHMLRTKCEYFRLHARVAGNWTVGRACTRYKTPTCARARTHARTQARANTYAPGGLCTPAARARRAPHARGGGGCGCQRRGRRRRRRGGPGQAHCVPQQHRRARILRGAVVFIIAITLLLIPPPTPPP